jgi:hypothetical protein
MRWESVQKDQPHLTDSEGGLETLISFVVQYGGEWRGTNDFGLGKERYIFIPQERIPLEEMGIYLRAYGPTRASPRA